MKKGKLYLIPTVISENTQEQVIPEFVKLRIKQVDYFLVENIRTARRFISSLKLGIAIEDLTFELLDKKTPIDRARGFMNPLFEGIDMGVMSESGCPGIADPGSLAVEIAHKNDIQVVPLVGPSSIMITLMASGFNGQSFTFSGYLPIDKKDRINKIKLLEENAYKFDQTQLFMDTPYRNNSMFDDIKANCNPNTLLCIARDVTGEKELIQTKSIKEWKESKGLNLHKIPVMFALYR